MPAKVAVASLYPPMWSGLAGGKSAMRDLGVGSEPEGLLSRQEKATVSLLNSAEAGSQLNIFLLTPHATKNNIYLN